MKKYIFLLVSLSVLILLVNTAFSQKKSKKSKQNTIKIDTVAVVKKAVPKVTFIELGSVTCIPCKKMQPIMKNIEQKYGEQVKVIFYDVWKDEAPGKQYGVISIPTQVFLDENGKEFKRHIGYFPEKEIDKIMLEKGIKPITN
jgi:thioredoxin 1